MEIFPVLRDGRGNFMVVGLNAVESRTRVVQIGSYCPLRARSEKAWGKFEAKDGFTPPQDDQQQGVASVSRCSLGT